MRWKPALARHRAALLSTAAHLGALVCLHLILLPSTHIAPLKLPGTAQGKTILVYYAPGGPPSQEAGILHKRANEPLLHHARPKPQKEAEKPAVEHAPAFAGNGSTMDSGAGDGEINIALSKYFPSPKPDLSALAHGTKGDVVLDAVIDEHGMITRLTLVRGLGDAIDQTVIATVKQWTFNPATRNGNPIPSEQELHFHYERS
jgi:protein TonB